MPIVVQHSPNPSIVGAAAYQASSNIESRRREEEDRAFNLQRRQVNANIANQQAARALQAQAQWQDFQRQSFYAGLDRSKAIAAAQAQQQALALDQYRLGSNYDLGLQQLYQRAAYQTPGIIGLSAQEAQGIVPVGSGGYQQPGGLNDYNQQMWAMESARQVDEQAAQMQAQYADANLSAEGQRIWGELAGNLRAIQSQRSSLRPDAYAQTMGQWFDKVQRSNVQQFVQPPPTIQAEMQRRVMPAGEGMERVLQPNGEIRYFETQNLPSGGGRSRGPEGEQSPQEMQMSDAEYFYGKGLDDQAAETRWNKMWDRAVRELEQEQSDRALESGDFGGQGEFDDRTIVQKMRQLRQADVQEAQKKAGLRQSFGDAARGAEEMQRRAGRPSDVRARAMGAQPQSGPPSVNQGYPGLQTPRDRPPVTQQSAVAARTSYQMLSERDAQQKQRYSDAMKTIRELEGETRLNPREQERLEQAKSDRWDAMRQRQKIRLEREKQSGVMEEFRQQQISSQPAVQSLKKAGLSPYDYAAARRVISQAKAKYPKMSEMPAEVRASVEEALSVINSAR